MSGSRSGALVAAWMVTALCGIMIFGLIAVPIISGHRQELGSVRALFVAFFFCLPIAFFKVATEVRQLRDENRTLRDRLDSSSGEKGARSPGALG